MKKPALHLSYFGYGSTSRIPIPHSGLDSSYGERKELAAEPGFPADKMGDSAQMNMWLHKEVMKKLAENGGNIPAELLD
uniref:DUF3597 domain-containing protein n=1 Tax=Chlorobium phaeobacteroides (strain BS1) TaxID=331678 RepID=B3EJX5_CHLPB